MRGIQKKIPLIIFLLLVAGCARPLQVNYNVAPPAEPGELEEPITILVTPFIDARGATADPLVIGDISVTVSDMTARRLVLEKNPAEIVTTAFQKELSLAGYTVVDGDNGEADYVLSGELREFRLNLGARDEIAVEVFSRVSTKKDGRVVWEGVKKESGDRFAGVMGNSRRTVSNYISATLSKVIRKGIADWSPRMASPGAGPYYTRTPGPNKTPIPPGQGRLVISTDPPRAKVYLDGVYYGLTPTSIDIEPGVYDLTLTQPGLKDYTERVAVRAGRATVLESTLGNREQ
jgi:hypothetical protein